MMVKAFDELNNKEFVENCGCHEFAGGITLKKDTEDDIMMEVYENIMNTIIKEFR